MDQEMGHEHYWTTLVDNRVEGFTSLLLHRERFGQVVIAAKVTFWDAAGEYYLQTFAGDVPLDIVEQIIAEARERLPNR